jgi:phospholipase C
LRIFKSEMLLRMTALCLLLAATVFAAPVVTVISPQSGWTVNSPIYYAASATSPNCSKGIAAMRIYIAPHVAVFSIDAPQFETFVNVKPGTYDTVVQAWDNCGEVTKIPLKVTVSTSGGVTVYSPSNGSASSSPTRFVASAGSPACARGISAIRIYTAPGVEAHTETANHLDANLNLTPGTYNTVVQAWDNCGHLFKVPITTTVKAPVSVPAHPPAPAR